MPSWEQIWGIWQLLPPNKESISTSVWASLASSVIAAGTSSAWNSMVPNWWQNEMCQFVPLQEMEMLMLRCCWFFLLLVLKNHQMVWKNCNVHILYHIVILIHKRLSPKVGLPWMPNKRFPRKSVLSAFWRRTSSRHLPGICYLHCVIMWRNPPIHALSWVVPKHWVFPCGMSWRLSSLSFGALEPKKIYQRFKKFPQSFRSFFSLHKKSLKFGSTKNHPVRCPSISNLDWNSFNQRSGFDRLQRFEP